MTTATQNLRTDLRDRLEAMRETGVLKPERVMSTPQGTHVRDDAGRDVLNLCANNYLGLADDPRVVAAAESARRRVGLRHGLACASSAARRRSTATSSSGSRRTSAPRTRCCSARASTRTAACSRRCSTSATR